MIEREERRRTTLGRGHVDQQPPLHGELLEKLGLFPHIDAGHQAQAANAIDAIVPRRRACPSFERHFPPSSAERSTSFSFFRVLMTAQAAAQASGLPPKVVPCVPGVNALDISLVETRAPIGTPPPRALAKVVNVRNDVEMLEAEPFARAVHPGLYLVNDHQGAGVVAHVPGGPRMNSGVADITPPSPLDRFQQHGGRFPGDGRLQHLPGH